LPKSRPCDYHAMIFMSSIGAERTASTTASIVARSL
jgi:hypothetical protein